MRRNLKINDNLKNNPPQPSLVWDKRTCRSPQLKLDLGSQKRSRLRYMPISFKAYTRHTLSLLGPPRWRHRTWMFKMCSRTCECTGNFEIQILVASGKTYSTNILVTVTPSSWLNRLESRVYYPRKSLSALKLKAWSLKRWKVSVLRHIVFPSSDVLQIPRLGAQYSAQYWHGCLLLLPLNGLNSH